MVVILNPLKEKASKLLWLQWELLPCSAKLAFFSQCIFRSEHLMFTFWGNCNFCCVLSQNAVLDHLPPRKATLRTTALPGCSMSYQRAAAAQVSLCHAPLDGQAWCLQANPWARCSQLQHQGLTGEGIPQEKPKLFIRTRNHWADLPNQTKSLYGCYEDLE